MKRFLSIAALLLIATAGMANAPKPEPKPEPQGEGGHCVEYSIECGNGSESRGKICGRATAQEVVDDVIAIAERVCR